MRNATPKFVKKWLEETNKTGKHQMGNFLSTPNTEVEHHTFKSSENLEVGIGAMQGWRIEMEDAHVAQDFKTCPNHLFVGIFDGHGGDGSAKYAAEHLLKTIESRVEFKNYVNGGCSDVGLLKEALRKGFVELDKNLREHQDNSNGSDSSGCTAVTAVISPDYIICANAGDSRCILGTNNRVKAMSFDHKPSDEPERKRIVDAGGMVQWKRVDGDLAVSRAFGDFVYKNRSDLEPGQQKVSCVPEFEVHERTGQDEFLLLACDGVWDVLTNEDASSHIRNLFKDWGEDLAELVADDVTQLSLVKGSKDNISALVVKLPGLEIGSPTKGGARALQAQRITEAETEKESYNFSYQVETREMIVVEEEPPSENDQPF